MIRRLQIFRAKLQEFGGLLIAAWNAERNVEESAMRLRQMEEWNGEEVKAN
jgi:hypothetical protein